MARVIYTIEAMSGTGKQWRHAYWGYFFREKDARAVIEENQTDICENGHYRYVVLQSRGQGPLAIGDTLEWYEMIVDESGKFLQANKIKRPAIYKHYYGDKRVAR